MKRSHKKVRIGILGCGAIGSRIARSMKNECADRAFVNALFDINPAKSEKLLGVFPKKISLKNPTLNC